MGKKRKLEDVESRSGHTEHASSKKHEQKHHHASNGTSNDKRTQNATPPKSYTAYLAELDLKLPPKAPLAQIPAAPSQATPSAPTSTNPSTPSPDLPPLPELSPALQEVRFTHPSMADDKYRKSDNYNTGNSYERLEFLGDAYVELISSRLIYPRFPHLQAGKMSTLREKLVRNATLATFAKRYGFEKKVKMDKIQTERLAQFDFNSTHQKRSGGKNAETHSPEKVLADVFEAYVAAVVLSDDTHGFATAEAWLTALWAPMLLDAASGQFFFGMVENRKDELARLVGGKFVKLDYEVVQVVSARPEDHRKIVAVYLTGWGHEKFKLGEGQGPNAKEAGMRAAGDALDNNRVVLEQIADIKREADRKRWEGESGLGIADTGS